MVRASLFATCLVDQFFPQVGVSTVNLLRRLEVQVDFPVGQTCCGQPAFNSGYRSHALPLALRWLDLFQDSEYVVVPSGSCAAMLKVYTPELLKDNPKDAQRAVELARRTYELSQFLVDVLKVTDVGASYPARITYHASCHLLRELGVSSQPLALLRGVRGAEFAPMEAATECCGFGGTFAVKYADISTAILAGKLRAIEVTEAEAVVACDMGCLMHMGGAMRRRGMKTRPMHLACSHVPKSSPS
ncbi:MAG: (Fe-S)-binding protein [Chloroflexi bacterium]|nr:(Fe-S)-binding protein [Chloroflexota bacterium]